MYSALTRHNFYILTKSVRKCVHSAAEGGGVPNANRHCSWRLKGGVFVKNLFIWFSKRYSIIMMI